MISFAKTYTFSFLAKTYDIQKVLTYANAGKYDISNEEAFKMSFDPLVPILMREISMPLKAKVLKTFESGMIKPIFIPDTENFPNSIPFIVKRVNEEMMVMINIAPFSIIKREKSGLIWYKIDYRKFYALLQSAYIYRIYAMDYKSFVKSDKFILTVCDAYSRMMYYTLDKYYSVGGIYENITKIMVLSAYYFASSCMDAVDAKAIASALPSIDDKVSAHEFVKILPNQINITTFDKFIDLLKEYVSSLSNITTEQVMSNYARDWNSAALTGLEFLPYFLHIIGSAYVGAEFTKDIVVVRLLRLTGQDIFKQLSVML